MPNWCYNSIIIPKSAVKSFVRKFCAQGKVKRFKDKTRTLPELSFNRVVRMPKNVTNEQFEERWGTHHDAFRTEFHNWSDNYVQVVFDTAWSKASDLLLSEICKRLNVDVEHSWLELSGDEPWGTVEYEPANLAGNDSPFVHNGVQSYEMERTEDQYRYVAELFFGDSCYADELVAKYKGSWEDDD